jgi:signal transduction histidine kinase
VTFRLAQPQTTIRWRLTLLYGGLFVACGAALLAVTYTLVSKATVPPKPTGTGRPICARPLVNTARTGETVGPDMLCRASQAKVAPAQVRRLLQSPAGNAVVRIAATGQRTADLHQLEIESGIALAIMAVVAATLGWLLAGRVLRPLRTITSATQQISEANLHHRLAMRGPRDELRTLADTVDGLLERLEGAFDAQRQFVSNASHELRTPLTATRALLEMSLSDPNATVETFEDACRQALEESEEQERLIDGLLALAHGQRGIAQREVIDLAALTARVLERREPDADAAGLGLDVSLKPAFISGDRHLIERLVSNLVDNAIRHNAPDGVVRALVEQRAGQSRLRVANSGPPVPQQEVERLLQPFHRLAPDRVGHRDGLGLGLSIVEAIAAAHGANLAIRPRSGGGLEVEVWFQADRRPGSPLTGVAAARTLSRRRGGNGAIIREEGQ